MDLKYFMLKKNVKKNIRKKCKKKNIRKKCFKQLYKISDLSKF